MHIQGTGASNTTKIPPPRERRIKENWFGPPPFGPPLRGPGVHTKITHRSPNAHFVWNSALTALTIPRKDPQERMKIVAGEGKKKERNFGRSCGGRSAGGGSGGGRAVRESGGVGREKGSQGEHPNLGRTHENFEHTSHNTQNHNTTHTTQHTPHNTQHTPHNTPPLPMGLGRVGVSRPKNVDTQNWPKSNWPESNWPKSTIGLSRNRGIADLRVGSSLHRGVSW